MGYAWCFPDMNPSGSISFSHISRCFTAFSCLGWEKASSCFQLWLENCFISPSQVSLHREVWLAACCWYKSSPVVRVGWGCCSRKGSWLLLDLGSAGAQTQGSGSADAKWGQEVLCSRWHDCSAGSGGKLLQIRIKRKRFPYHCGKQLAEDIFERGNLQ